MKKVFFLLIAVFALSCANNAGKELDSKPLTDFLSKQVVGQSGSLSLKEFKAFDWDLVHVLPPYAVVDKRDTLVASAASAIERTDIKYRDDANILVFFNKGKLVGTMEVGRKLDFALLGEKDNNGGRSYKRNDCVFAYKVAGGDIVQISIR